MQCELSRLAVVGGDGEREKLPLIGSRGDSRRTLASVTKFDTSQGRIGSVRSSEFDPESLHDL
jgi:hypothetical protein